MPRNLRAVTFGTHFSNISNHFLYFWHFWLEMNGNMIPLIKQHLEVVWLVGSLIKFPNRTCTNLNLRIRTVTFGNFDNPISSTNLTTRLPLCKKWHSGGASYRGVFACLSRFYQLIAYYRVRSQVLWSALHFPPECYFWLESWFVVMCMWGRSKSNCS